MIQCREDIAASWSSARATLSALERARGAQITSSVVASVSYGRAPSGLAPGRAPLACAPRWAPPASPRSACVGGPASVSACGARPRSRSPHGLRGRSRPRFRAPWLAYGAVCAPGLGTPRFDAARSRPRLRAPRLSRLRLPAGFAPHGLRRRARRLGAPRLAAGALPGFAPHGLRAAGLPGFAPHGFDPCRHSVPAFAPQGFRDDPRLESATVVLSPSGVRARRSRPAPSIARRGPPAWRSPCGAASDRAADLLETARRAVARPLGPLVVARSCLANVLLESIPLRLLRVAILLPRIAMLAARAPVLVGRGVGVLRRSAARCAARRSGAGRFRRGCSPWRFGRSPCLALSRSGRGPSQRRSPRPNPASRAASRESNSCPRSNHFITADAFFSRRRLSVGSSSSASCARKAVGWSSTRMVQYAWRGGMGDHSEVKSAVRGQCRLQNFIRYASDMELVVAPIASCARA